MIRLAAAALLGSFVCLPSCAPIAAPGRYMREVDALPSAPPPGKAMVVFHRPRAHQGHPLYFGLWDEFDLVANLGNGQSLAYVCDPGPHRFIGRSAEIKTVVDAELRAGKVYDCRTTTGGWWIASFHLVPITTDAERGQIDAWMQEHRLVARDASGFEDYAAGYKKKLETILAEADAGDLKRVPLPAAAHR